MKRICIFTVYNEQGIIYPYLEFYINSIKNVVEELVIIVNGNLRSDGENILRKYTNRVYKRENIGFDVAAHQEALERYITTQEIITADELILANDTCFGPFEPFEAMFKMMEEKNVDYWGITEAESPWAHLQSYFMVFRKPTIKCVTEYLCNRIQKNVTEKMMVVYQFEFGLSRLLWIKGYKRGTYSKLNRCDLFVWPYQQLKNGGCPILKIRSFERYKENRENIIEALKYIKDNYSYNLEYITTFVENKYGIQEDWDTLLNNTVYVNDTNPLFIPSATVEQVDAFCRNNKELFIYGAGSRAHYIYWYYKDVLGGLKGFIVSDKTKDKEKFEGYPIYEISEIVDKNSPILVALGIDNTMEVREILAEFNNVLYLWNN